MHVHHLSYEGDSPWDTPTEGLITLCKDCHDDETKIASGERRLFLEAFRKNGWMAAQFNEVACDVYGYPPLHFMPDVESAILAAAYRIPTVRKALVDAYWAYLRERRRKKAGDDGNTISDPNESA